MKPSEQELELRSFFIRSSFSAALTADLSAMSLEEKV